MMKSNYFLIIFFCISFSFAANAQNKNQISICETFFNESYISDGQYNNTIIKKGESKSINITLLGGNTYRIAVCGEKSKKIHYTLKDQKGNILFSNKEFEYAPYWDFEIKQTLECNLIMYNDDTTISNDKTILIIGYKK